MKSSQEPIYAKIINLIVATSIAVVLGVGGTFAAEPPTEHKGVSVFGKAVLELGTQIPAMKGYKIQVRSVVVKPNGVVNFMATARDQALFMSSKATAYVSIKVQMTKPVALSRLEKWLLKTLAPITGSKTKVEKHSFSSLILSQRNKLRNKNAMALSSAEVPWLKS